METALNNKHLKIESHLPVFPGFYGTFFEYHGEEGDIENYNEQHGTDYDSDRFKWDYADYSKRIAEACVQPIEDYLKADGFQIGISFDKLHSPREYNFTNDKVFVTYHILQFDYDDLVKYCFKEHADAFDQYLQDHYASRPGFYSFTGADFDQWENEYLTDPDYRYFANCFYALLAFYLENEGYEETELLEAVSNENWCSMQLDLGVYYQPEFKTVDGKEVIPVDIHGNELHSFEVYDRLEDAQNDFPDYKILEFSGNDIEHPTFVETRHVDA